MTLWNPIWRVTINGVNYENYVLANLTATSGRSNIYEQAQAGYLNLQLYNVTQSQVNININDAVGIAIKDSTDTFVPIWGGSVTDLSVEVTSGGSVAINQVISIVALGALSRLPKANWLTNLNRDFDGNQILEVLTDLLINNWSEVPAALTWGTYTPATETWQMLRMSDLVRLIHLETLTYRRDQPIQSMSIHWFHRLPRQDLATFTKMLRGKFHTPIQLIERNTLRRMDMWTFQLLRH